MVRLSAKTDKVRERESKRDTCGAEIPHYEDEYTLKSAMVQES